MIQAVKPSRTVWFWVFIVGVLTLLSSVALLWQGHRQQRAHFLVAQSTLAAATGRQLGVYDALLAQTALSKPSGDSAPLSLIKVSVNPNDTQRWQVVAANVPEANFSSGANFADWVGTGAQVFTSWRLIKAPEPGLLIAQPGCEVAGPECDHGWFAFVPIHALPGAREAGWRLLLEQEKGLTPVWPQPVDKVVNQGVAKENVQFFTWRGKRWAVYADGPGWPWWGSALALVMSVFLAALVGVLLWLREVIENQAREQASADAMESVSDEALLIIRPDGKITRWSRGAILLWEYGPREALGLSVTQLFRGPGLSDALNPLAKGKQVRGVELQGKNAKGVEFSVRLNAVPILNRRKQVVGAALSMFDLRPEKTAQTRLMAQEKILAHNMSLLEKNADRFYSLEQGRRQLQTVLDAVPFVIGYWDKNQINQVANRAHQGRYGVDMADIPGMSLQELLSPEDYAAQLGRVQAVLAGMAQSYEYTQTNSDGALQHFLGQYLPDTSKTGVRGFYVIEQEITELVEGNLRLGQALEENEVLLTTINNQLLYSVTDARGVILDVNTNYCAALGYEREELLGQTHRLVNSGVHSEDFWRGLWECLMAGNPWRAELCNRTQDGQERWFDTVIAPFHGATGKVEKCVALSIDITSRKAVEQEHQRLGQLLRDVLAAASEVAIIATDTTGAITLFNQGAERMLGYRAEDMLGEFAVPRLHLPEEISAFEAQAHNPEDLSGFALLSAQVLQAGPHTQQWTYRRQDGSQLNVSVTLSAMRDHSASDHNSNDEHASDEHASDPENALVGYLIVAADITESLKQQQALVSAKDQLMVAAEVAELGVWEYLPETNRLSWNERMFEIFDQPADEPPEGIETWFERVHPEEQTQIAALFERGIQQQAEFEGVFRFLTPAGALRYIQLGAHFECNLAGQVFKVTGISRDITGQQELENQLRQAKEQADAANLSKSQFLANMSHEIRTPMNAVLGMLQLVGQTQLGLRQQDYVNKAQTAAKSLLGLLNDILDFSKIDAGKLVIDPTACALDDICADVAVVMAGNQADKPVEVIFDLAPELPRAVLIDKLRIQQVLINLIGNALKFTAQGQIWVRLTCADGANENATRVLFSIQDTGIGIHPDQQQRIFTGFVQAEASTTRRYGGTGLGLVITKNLIDLMGGQLRLHSELGQGSTFSFELPLPPAQTPTLSAKPALAGSVLLVHETPLALSVLERDLTHLGFEVTCAHSAADALSLAEGHARRGESFSLALVDWRLSESNGLNLGRQLHAINPNPLAVILLLTQREKEHLAQLHGHDAQYLWHLSKPIVRPGLEQVLRLVLSGDKSQPNTPETQQILAGTSLLVVEDNPLNRQVAAELLGGVGAQISLAVDGLDGVHKACAKGAHYDLILMDLQMPNLDGLEATRKLRALGHTLPILAMTANASAEDKDACLAAGMNGHLSKPIDLNLVISAICNALGTQNTPQAANEPEREALKTEPLDESFDMKEQQAEATQSAGEEMEPEESNIEEMNDDEANDEKTNDEETNDVEANNEEANIEEANIEEANIEELAGEERESDERNTEQLKTEEAKREETQKEEPNPQNSEHPAPSAKPAETAPPTPEPQPPTDEWVEDLDSILRRFGGKRALFQKMLANLEPETQRLLEELKSACQTSDRPRATAAAHSLKGTAATFGAKALSQRAAQLEKRLKTTEEDLTTILTPEAYTTLEEALVAALAELGQRLAA
ncbi:MAG: hypothetical protein RL497_1595 [Pseudomonadota bacterium]